MPASSCGYATSPLGVNVTSPFTPLIKADVLTRIGLPLEIASELAEITDEVAPLKIIEPLP